MFDRDITACGVVVVFLLLFVMLLLFACRHGYGMVWYGMYACIAYYGLLVYVCTGIICIQTLAYSWDHALVQAFFSLLGLGAPALVG